MIHKSLQSAMDLAADHCRAAGVPNSQIADFFGFAEESGARKAVMRARVNNDDKATIEELADQVGCVVSEILSDLRYSRDVQLLRDLSILVRVLCVLRGQLRMEFFINRQ